MKTIRNSMAILIALVNLVFTLTLAGCSKDESVSPSANLPNNEDCLNYSYSDSLPTAASCITSLPFQDLSPAEVDALTIMREEEYLAYDVYLAFSRQYSKPVFQNISKSEFRHTEATKALLLKYNLPDPGASHTEGVFQNSTLQELYNTLVGQGAESLIQALIVGATIEDLDIVDLKNHLANVDNEDITKVFNNLMRGSRNHLRSFYRNILIAGGTYSPHYLTLDEFNAIINSEHETGPGN